jgi:D-inositol-3-phosphate glycosyltransferase
MVTHANFFMSALAAMELKRELGIPFVVTFHALGRVRRMHQSEADQFPAQRMEIEDAAIAQADAIIAE